VRPQWDDGDVAVRTEPVLRPFARLIDGWGLRETTLTGVLGSVLIAVGSVGAGALPANDPSRLIPVLKHMRGSATGLHVALGFCYLGLVLVILAWLLFGRLLMTGSTHGVRRATGQVLEPRTVRGVAIAWMLPLLAGMPIASMDLYSYAAQAQIARNGLDPYTFTPADLPGKFLDNVAGNWVDTPSPYGPLWVAISRWVASVTGDHALITVLILRLIPFAALLFIAHLIPGLASKFGKRGDLAMWLAVANPLVIVHGVGGGHNDIVMMALAMAGLAIVLEPGAGVRHLAAGAALATLAAAVKFPAVVLLAFTVPFFMIGRGDRRVSVWLRHCLLVAALAVPLFLLTSWVADVGLGWTKQVNSAVRVVNFMSLPTIVGVALRAIVGSDHGPLVDSTVRAVRSAGTILSGVLLIALWLRATRRPPAPLLALGLAITVVLSPAVQPWYFVWAIMIAALFVVQPHQLSWLAALSVALVLMTTPMGSPVDMVPYIPAVIIAGLGSRALLGPVAESGNGGVAA